MQKIKGLIVKSSVLLFISNFGLIYDANAASGSSDTKTYSISIPSYDKYDQNKQSNQSNNQSKQNEAQNSNNKANKKRGASEASNTQKNSNNSTNKDRIDTANDDTANKVKPIDPINAEMNALGNDAEIKNITTNQPKNTGTKTANNPNNNNNSSNSSNGSKSNTANNNKSAPAGAKTATGPIPDKTLDIALIEQLTGMKGEYDENQKILQLTVPRYDLAITIDGVRMSPEMGLNSWFAFKTIGNKVVMLGDLVLSEDQVNTVMSAVLDNGFKVTALRSRYLWDTPKVMYMRIEGRGDEQAVATALAKIFVKIREHNSANGKKSYSQNSNGSYSRYSKARSRINPSTTFLTTNKIDEIIGLKGYYYDKIYKISVGKMLEASGIPGVNPDTDPTVKYRAGNRIAKSSKLNITIAFSGSDHEALMNGDFVVPESKLQEVLKTLRNEDIKILSIYPQMPGIKNNPTKMIAIHYWSTGAVDELAQSIREAINVVVD